MIDVPAANKESRLTGFRSEMELGIPTRILT